MDIDVSEGGNRSDYQNCSLTGRSGFEDGDLAQVIREAVDDVPESVAQLDFVEDINTMRLHHHARRLQRMTTILFHFYIDSPLRARGAGFYQTGRKKNFVTRANITFK